MRKIRLWMAWGVVPLLVACGADSGTEARVVPTAPLVAMTAAAEPSPTQSASATPEPSATLVAVTPTTEPSATATEPPTPTTEPSATATEPPTPTTEPTTPPPTPTPDAVGGLTIPDFRGRSFGDSEITIGEVWQRGTGYTSYRISYSVDGLRLTGLLHIPDGAGPFPLVIANRGTISRDIYQPGMDSRAFSDLMASNGFLVVAPDFRGYGGGDDGPNPFYTGYYADVLGLIPQAQRLPMARPGKVGMWGHSRGASVTIAALTITDQIAAAVAYAPAPADLAVDYVRRFQQSGGNPGSGTWPFPPDQNPDAYRRISPLNYLDAVGAPLMLHHGTADSTVDESASVTIAETLRGQGKDVELFLYEGAGHALQGAAYNEYADRTLRFFRLHLGVQ